MYSRVSLEKIITEREAKVAHYEKKIVDSTKPLPTVEFMLKIQKEELEFFKKELGN